MRGRFGLIDGRLAPDEAELLQDYRGLASDTKAAVTVVLRGLAKQK